MHGRIVSCRAVPSITRTAHTGGAEGRDFDSTNVLTGAGDLSSKGLRVHAPMVFRSPKKSFANASEFFATPR